MILQDVISSLDHHLELCQYRITNRGYESEFHEVASEHEFDPGWFIFP